MSPAAPRYRLLRSGDVGDEAQRHHGDLIGMKVANAEDPVDRVFAGLVNPQTHIEPEGVFFTVAGTVSWSKATPSSSAESFITRFL